MDLSLRFFDLFCYVNAMQRQERPECGPTQGLHELRKCSCRASHLGAWSQVMPKPKILAAPLVVEQDHFSPNVGCSLPYARALLNLATLGLG